MGPLEEEEGRSEEEEEEGRSEEEEEEGRWEEEEEGRSEEEEEWEGCKTLACPAASSIPWTPRCGPRTRIRTGLWEWIWAEERR